MPDGGPGPGTSAAPTHTTSSWWDSTSGPADAADEAGTGADAADGSDAFPPDQAATARGPAAERGGRAAPGDRPPRPGRDGPEAAAPGGEAVPDPASAALDLARALTDPRSGGLRGRLLRGILGGLPIAFGLGWLVGELTGCGRFSATCDPSVGPLVIVGQGTILAALLLLPEIAAVATGAALALLAAAVGVSLILSATGTAADEGSRRAALGALLVVAWLSGLAIAVVRRVRSGPPSAGPVS